MFVHVISFALFVSVAVWQVVVNNRVNELPVIHSYGKHFIVRLSDCLQCSFAVTVADLVFECFLL